MATKFIILSMLISCSVCNPAGFIKETGMENLVEEMRSGCSDGSDPFACFKVKVMSLLDSIFKRESFQVSESVEVVRNEASNEVSARSSNDFFDNIENYIQSHDVTFKLPLDTKVIVSPRHLDSDELNLNIKFDEEAKSSGVEGRKSKIRKIIIPILVFVLLKAMTLIPLALGVLGLKAWNALQLSFFSFIVSVALAIFQLCKKIAADNSHPSISAHGPWDGTYAATYRHKRSVEPNFLEDGQNMAYNAYV